jgi:hypothetical protein
MGHTVKHNEFVVNILEGVIFGKKVVGRPRLQGAENFASTGIHPWTIQPVASRYTDWATRPHKTLLYDSMIFVWV